MSTDDQHGWFALQTRVGRERTVASILEAKWYELFLPLVENRRQWSDRVKRTVTPLFPGYVFCRTTSDAVGRMVTIHGVCRIVGFGKSPALVDDKEIEAIRRIIAAGLPACPTQYLRAGQRVAIADGPLSGLEGIFVRAGNQHQLVVSVELLQRSIAVQIDASCVRPQEALAS
jgi:transcription antitermination factor NusG